MTGRTLILKALTCGILFSAALPLVASSACAAPSVVALPGDRAFPESVTSTTDGTLYAGSLASGGVFRAMPGAAQADVWIKPGTFGTRSILGVLADEKSGTLWVCSNDMSKLGVPGPGSATGSALAGFDLKTGAGKISAKFPGTHTFCNDMAVGADGSVYVTDSFMPQILRLPPGGKQLEVWLKDPKFQPAQGFGLDGIVFGGDGSLYVDTFTEAKLFHVEVKDGKAGAVTQIEASRPLELTDALRPIGGDAFLLIEGAGRLDRMTVEGDSATIETIKDGLLGPTGVTLIGNIAWVSEGQLSYLFGKKGQAPKLPFQLSSAPLQQP